MTVRYRHRTQPASLAGSEAARGDRAQQISSTDTEDAMNDTEHCGTAPQRTATTTGQADMKGGQDHATTADQRYLDNAGRLHRDNPERLVRQLVSATAQEVAVPRPHDVARGADVAGRHPDDASGPQVAAPVEAITGLVTRPREHPPGPALRAAGVVGHRTLKCSPTGRRQPDAILLRTALEVCACVRS
jgi:hypothetical protein